MNRTKPEANGAKAATRGAAEKEIRILIVDDHAIIRQGLRQILSTAFTKAEFGEASSANEALEVVAKQRWDVVLLDINLPQLNGLEVLAKLKAAHPKLPVIVVSVESKPETLVQASELGADGYVLKHLPREKIIQRLSEVFDSIEEATDGEISDEGSGSTPAV